MPTNKAKVTQLDVKRFEKECEKTKQLYETFKTKDREFGASLLSNYRALDNDALRKAAAEKYGIRSQAVIDILIAIFDTDIPKSTIKNRLAAARTWEVVPDRSDPPVPVEAARMLGGGIGDSPQDKKKLKKRIKTAEQIAKAEGSEVITKAHAAQARQAENENITDVRSWKKQADELALVYGVIHGLEAINHVNKKIRPERFVQVMKDDAKDAFEKEWAQAFRFLTAVEDEL